MSDSRDDGSRYLRTELLERIAHELRGPAGVTLGALDELEHGLDPAVVDQNRALFAMARRGARRVLRTAERLTRTAQFEGASAHVMCVPCDLRSVVAQAVKDAEGIEGRSSIRIETVLPDDATECQGDSAWLLVALTELVSQSIRSARRSVAVSLQRVEDAAVVRVSDDRSVIMDSPAARFVPLKDRRDAALGWPLVCDVARAHRGALQSEPLLDAKGAVTGLAVTLRLPNAS
ncbi:MAG: putative two-component sensor kinase [Myxococcaceae bacterium]|nr:putative two-component sensor kinase [Myxococcaceae bacterium]